MSEQTQPAEQDPTKTAESIPETAAPAIETPKVEEAAPKTETKESSADSKVEETKTEESSETEKEKVVPEQYDLKPSENSLLEETALTRIAAIAKAQGLSQEEAQELLLAQEEDVAAYMKERKATWHKQALADKDIGGEKLKENISLASRAIDKFASQSLKAELDKTGYGNHPELIKMFAKIGKEMAEDRAIIPAAKNAGSVPLEDVFYPDKEGA